MADLDRHAQTLAIMRLAPVIPVLTVKDVEDGLRQARALVAGGLPAIEITLRTAGALDAIAAIAKSVPGATVGAGTIVSLEQIEQALNAGARFLVSPGCTAKLAAAVAATGIPYLPGVASASEAMALREYGFRTLKLFPAEAVGGARLLASLAAPLPEFIFCPTGGVDLIKAQNYLALPNVACVGGSWMTPKDAVASGDVARIEALARKAAKLRG